MVTAVLETTVLVDLLRQHSPAAYWFRSQTQTTFGITPIIWMEVIGGGPNKIKRLQAAKLMQQFEMIYFTQVDLDWAMEHQILYELRFGVGMMDCLIASVCNRLQLPLYTHNLKHFVPLLDDLAQKPY